MNFGNIKEVDIADGPGVRVSLFVSGCSHHCRGCFQPETWDPSYGEPYTAETEKRILTLLSRDFIQGLTLLGGEPFEPENQRVLTGLLQKVRALRPKKDVWCYTGYLLDEELWKESRARCEVTDEMLSMLDVLVDGEFEEEKKNLSLTFRGSENQRIIDVPASLAAGETVLVREYL